jgi:hypothetical protein
MNTVIASIHLSYTLTYKLLVCCLQRFSPTPPVRKSSVSITSLSLIPNLIYLSCVECSGTKLRDKERNIIPVFDNLLKRFAVRLIPNQGIRRTVTPTDRVELEESSR